MGLKANKSRQKKTFDMIFIGAGLINIFESIYHLSRGKKILIIDKCNDIGGVWKPINIFSLHNVENAVHYFLYDKYGINFMQNVLNWDIVKSKKKYRVFSLFNKIYIKTSYQNHFVTFLYKIIDLFKTVIKDPLKSFHALSKNNSNLNYYYVSGGAPEIISKTKKMIKKTNLGFRFNCEIENIKINSKNNTVIIETNSGTFKSKKLLISHGTRIKNITVDNLYYKVKEIFLIRPAVHIFVEDFSPTYINEAIFMSDPIIKYVHDVSRFTDENKKIKGKNKIFVFALQHEIKNSKGLKIILFNKLRRAGIIGKNSSLLAYKWTNYNLPTLKNNELDNIKNKTNGLIDFISTENFCSGIANNANKWKNLIS